MLFFFLIGSVIILSIRHCDFKTSHIYFVSIIIPRHLNIVIRQTRLMKQCLEWKFCSLGKGNQESLIAYYEPGIVLELSQSLSHL